MNRELIESVKLERVELIARLAADGVCNERDHEIALNLIAEIARDTAIKNQQFSVVFSRAELNDDVIMPA